MIFDIRKPYRVVEVKQGNSIVYKITQPKLFLFVWLTNKHYDIRKYHIGGSYTRWFKNKTEVDEFINNYKPVKITETIVFDSKRVLGL